MKISLALGTTPNFFTEDFFVNPITITDDELRSFNKLFGMSGLELSRFGALPANSSYKVTEFMRYADIQHAKNTLKYTAIEFTCSAYYSPLTLYPRENGYSQNDYYGDSDKRFKEVDKYYVINGNIYRKNFIDEYDIDNNCTHQSISLYEYVECLCKDDSVRLDMKNKLEEGLNFNPLKDFKKAYSRERHGMGTIGRLSANKFFWLNMILGKMTLNK